MSPQITQTKSTSESLTALSEFLLRPWFLAAFGLLLICACLVENHAFFHDDTFITLRYARHILEGYGPVWNIQGQRVEGFTSILHLLLVASVGALHVPLPTAARTVNVACHLILVLLVAAYLDRHTNRTGACLGALILATSWMLIVWDLGGLDAVLFTSLSAAGILTAIRHFDPANAHAFRSLILGSLGLAFATLARPEGGLFLIVLWLFAAFFPRNWPAAERMKSLAAAVGTAIIVLLPFVIFRWFFFHELVPNTFYAKIGGVKKLELLSMGIRYLISFLGMPPFLFLLSLAAAVYSIRNRRFTVQNTVLWGFIAAMILYISVSGGDHMTAARFFLPLVPLLTVALIQHLYQNDLLNDAKFLSVFAPVFLLMLALQVTSTGLNPRRMDSAARVGGSVGQYIHQHWSPGSVVALNTAGSTPYFADEMQYIDMLGLNDYAIARRKNVPQNGPWTHLPGHLKGDGASVLSRHPDYIILGPSEGSTAGIKKSVYFVGDYEIGNTPSFKADYEICKVTTNGFLLTFYQRRETHRPCPAGQ